jgi:hypothetical protein
MGCTCSKEEANNLIENHIENLNFPYIIKIHIPNTNNVKVILHDGNNTQMTLVELINLIFFCSNYSEEIDANFISIYDNINDKHNYYIERLFGFYIENIDDPDKGLLWKCYINKKEENWNFLCNNNKIISRKDEIEFKYEK